MKYTRYNVRKSKGTSVFFMIIIIMVLILAYIIGSITSKIFFSKASISIKNNSESKIASKIDNETEQEKTTDYVVIQCGIYDNKDNAESIEAELKSTGNPVVLEDNGKYNVLIGIYVDDSEAEEVLKPLVDKKIDAKKALYKIKVDNMCNAEIAGIVNGCLQIIDKLGEKNVHAVQTAEFKKWTSSLKDVDKNSDNISILNDIKSYVNGMPDEISKDNIPEINKSIFLVIKKIAQNIQ